MAETFATHTSWNAQEIRTRSLEILEQMRIRNGEEVLEKYPHQLSGGMLQRIMIGIAMALQPELLIADEPTTAIDAITQYEILEEFIRIKKQKNTAMLFITHDLGAISKVADRILVMNSGHVVDSGSFTTSLSMPMTRTPACWWRNDLPSCTATARSYTERRVPMLEVNNVCVSFRSERQEKLFGTTRDQVLFDVSLKVPKGTCLGILGESGGGKSTLGRVICGLLKPDSGELKIHDTSVYASRSGRKNLQKRLSVVFQDYTTSANPRFRVKEIIAEGLAARERNQKIRLNRAEETSRLLELVGLNASYADRYPHELSGGMRQRVMIACAMVTHPQLLIADEPTTALDVTIQAQIIALMEELQEKLGMSIIIITHDLGVVADMADEIIVMYAGEIVERGTARDIFYHQQHPYTWALLQSVPRIDDEDKTILNTIEGNIPDMIYPPKGCSFCTRCPYAMKICEEEKPKVTHITDEHSVACWLMDPRADRSGVPFGRTDA